MRQKSGESSWIRPGAFGVHREQLRQFRPDRVAPGHRLEQFGPKSQAGSAFCHAGLTEVLRRSETRSIMRRVL